MTHLAGLAGSHTSQPDLTRGYRVADKESGSKFLRSIFLRLKIPKLKVPKLKGPTTQSSYCSMFLRLKVPTVA